MKKFLLLIIAFCISLCGCNAQSKKFTSLDNEAFAKVISKKKTQVLDVRSPAEYTQGHLPKAINLDVNCKDFDRQIDKLNKKKPVAVYCRGGRRSKIAARKLADKGFTVYELDKGISQWKGKITQ